jgi:hypothetical protein
MAAIDDLYAALKAAHAAGDEAGASKLAGYIQSLPAEAPDTPTPTAPASYLDRVKANITGSLAAVPSAVQNLTLGAVRGAGSIGATVMAPLDAAARGLGVDPNGMVGSVIGRTDRRQAMTDATQTLGADPNSLAYKAGKLVTEVAGTAGAGGVLAKGAEGLGAAPELFNALRTSGFATGPSRLSAAGNLAVRSVGGAAAGGAQVGLASPDDAGTGALIGAALPPGLKVLGAAGSGVVNALAGRELSPQMAQAVSDARASGYVLPPVEINPSPVNSILQGASGKIKTSQVASAKNQPLTNRLIAQDVGADPTVPLSQEKLAQIRGQAGQDYQAVANTGTVAPTKSYTDALDKITAPYERASAGFPNAKPNPIIADIQSLKSPSFDASSAVAKISELRDQASTAYAKGDKSTGAAYKSAAGALEDAIDQHLQDIGAPSELLDNFRNARTLIAKTYTAGKALNNVTGNIDAGVYGNALSKGKPISGPSLQVAQAAQAFPKATQALKENPNALSPFDFMSGLAAATMSGHPWLGAAPLLRPAIRGAILSPQYQELAANGLSGLPRPPINALAPAAYRAAPSVGQQ